ncbi:PH domain-containing protein [Streptomyces sp. NPDC047009]|uniref:PH domain-containing protein n=1 Tax=Streptomyces sp. NPDC047009 TaxID=3154496 RepID=UPI0033C62DDE
MQETIRIPWTSALAALSFQPLALTGLGGVVGSPGVIRPWLYGALAVAWASLTWRAVAMRVRVSPEGIRSHGLWRTRFVPWDDLVVVQSFPGPGLLECPMAILFDGSLVELTGVYGLRSEDESRVDRIAERLNALCDQA